MKTWQTKSLFGWGIQTMNPIATVSHNAKNTKMPASWRFRYSDTMMLMHWWMSPKICKVFCLGYEKATCKLGGALTRIIFSGVLLSNFWCLCHCINHYKRGDGRNEHQHRLIPFLQKQNDPSKGSLTWPHLHTINSPVSELGRAKVLHAMQACQVQRGFHNTMPTLMFLILPLPLPLGWV